MFTGVAMGDELGDFTRRSGRTPQVWQQFVAWNRPYRWAMDLARAENRRLMLALSTAPGQDEPGTISPGGIAAGRGDHWLLELRADIGGFGLPVYVRPMGEMNNCHNAYAPIACSGASRGSTHSTAAFIAAWRRIAAIMRGDSRQGIDAELAALGQRRVRWHKVDLLPAKVAMVWSPMTGGSPMISALDPARFWPGSRYVDWIGTSFYSKFPNFGWLSTYYDRFARGYRKPFMLAEWAMWENGDPSFVRQTLAWIRARPRAKMVVYNQGKDPAGPFRLRNYPGAAQALRSGLSAGPFALAWPR